MRMSITTMFQVSGGALDVDAHLDAVMDRLLGLGALDPSIGGSLASGQVEVSLDVEETGVSRALDGAFDLIHAAIAAAGGTVFDSLGDSVTADADRAGDAPRWDRRSLSVAA